MTWAARIFIPERPRPQGRPVFGKGFARDPERSRDWKAFVRGSALEAWYDEEKDAGIPVLPEGPVELLACFFLPRAKRHGSGPPIPLSWTPDLSNLLKALEDGLNGLAWSDDAQIARIEAEVWTAGEGFEVGVSVLARAWGGELGPRLLQ